MNKLIILLVVILIGCSTPTGTPQATYTPAPTYTPLPTSTPYPTATAYPTPTKTPVPELFRMPEHPLPIAYGSMAIMQVWCHFQYNYWIVYYWGMVFHRDDLDGLKETWCVQHNGKLQ